MLIRRAETKDIPKITDLLNQVLKVHCDGRPDLFKANCRKYYDSELEEILKDDSRPVFVAETDGSVLGYAFCIFVEHKNDNILTDIKTLYIDDLCVDASLRGRGAGKALYEYVLAFAKESGCYNVTLNVWACNAEAMGFYEHLGLVPQKIGMEAIIQKH